jgi:alpha/beta superfamily hydrolase
MKKIWFRNSRGQRLCGILHEAGKEKAIVMAHGFAADKDEEGIFVRTAEAMCKEGFSVLRFDFAGSGESEGEFSEMTLSSEAEDLKSAFEFMKSHGYRRIGLVAASFGGAVAMIAHPDAEAVVLWNPRSKKGRFSSLERMDKDWRRHIET